MSMPRRPTHPSRLSNVRVADAVETLAQHMDKEAEDERPYDDRSPRLPRPALAEARWDSSGPTEAVMVHFLVISNWPMGVLWTTSA
jgi:hypothetical protein